MQTKEINASILPEHQRSGFMPWLFTSKCFVLGENLLFKAARQLSDQYSGGLWQFVKLSNGSGFAYPESPETFKLYVAGNGFEGEVAREAFGIICTLFALSETCMFAYMRELHAANESLVDRSDRLKDYAQTLSEAAKIFRAID